MHTYAHVCIDNNIILTLAKKICTYGNVSKNTLVSVIDSKVKDDVKIYNFLAYLLKVFSSYKLI